MQSIERRTNPFNLEAVEPSPANESAEAFREADFNFPPDKDISLQREIGSVPYTVVDYEMQNGDPVIRLTNGSHELIMNITQFRAQNPTELTYH